MRKAAVLLFAVLCTCLAVSAQAPPAGSELTFWYEYTVKPGKDAAFMELVKTVGAPVRDKLMAEGVISGWGIEVPVVRGSIGGTHLIWFSTNWAGVEKVRKAMADQMEKVNADDAKAAAGAKKGQMPALTLQQRQEDAVDVTKTRDWLTRDLIYHTSRSWGANAQPFFRYNFIKVKPGKGGDYRAAWEKYTKPIYDQMIKDGTIVSYGFAVEEVRTSGNFTHFIWYGVKNPEAFDKVRAAFAAVNAKRTPEERNAIAAVFGELVEGDAARSAVTRAIIFKVRE